jgi:hypothetical protein
MQTSQTDGNAKREFKDEARKLINECLQRSTCHGIPNITNARTRVVCVIWFFCILASIAYCLYIMLQSTLTYFSYATLTSMEQARETPIHFPTVAFCNLNPFDENFAVAYITNHSEQFKEYACLATYSCTNPGEIRRKMISKFKRVLANDNATIGVRSTFGFNLNSSLFLCEFNGIKCFDSNFTRIWDNRYGFCYTFNGKNPILKISNYAPGSGLEIGLTLRK